MKTASETKKTFPKKIILILILVAVLILAVAGGVYAYEKYQKSKNPDAAAQNDAEDLVAQVGKLMKLPNETPVIATVSDVAKLGSQSLFKNAQNGDKVLIFNQSKKAIVYRPSTNQIVDTGNVVINNTDSASVSASTEKIRVVIFNGTQTSGYAKNKGEEIARKYPNIEVASTANASGEYTKTLVVDISGKNSQMAAALAAQLGGEVGSMPSDETKPDADLLIILGK